MNQVPVMTGGVGKEALREFYGRRFIPQMPPDTAMTLVSRTIGDTQLVDEMIFKFTHTVKKDWMLPGVPPTGKFVEVALIAVIGFRNGKLSHEYILLGPGFSPGAARFAGRECVACGRHRER